jgi:hypothetical protein
MSETVRAAGPERNALHRALSRLYAASLHATETTIAPLARVDRAVTQAADLGWCDLPKSEVVASVERLAELRDAAVELIRRLEALQ